MSPRVAELVADRLITTNWVRTAAWTVRAALAIAMLVAVLR